MEKKNAPWYLIVCAVATLVNFYLKITGVVDWHWAIVAAPAILYVASVVAAFVIAFIAAIVMGITLENMR